MTFFHLFYHLAQRVILGQHKQRMDMIGRPAEDDRRAADLLQDPGLLRMELGTNCRCKRGLSVLRAVNEVNEIHRQ